MVMIFSESEKELVRLCRTKTGILRMYDGPFTDWLFTKCENDPDDGDPLEFLVARFVEQRGPGPQDADTLRINHKYLGLITPFRWLPTLSEWLSLYSTSSDEPNSVNWVARIFLRSNKRDVTAKEIAETAELMRQLGFAPFGASGPSTVVLKPLIPRIDNSVQPKDIELPMPGTRIRK